MRVPCTTLHQHAATVHSATINTCPRPAWSRGWGPPSASTAPTRDAPSPQPVARRHVPLCRRWVRRRVSCAGVLLQLAGVHVRVHICTDMYRSCAHAPIQYPRGRDGKARMWRPLLLIIQRWETPHPPRCRPSAPTIAAVAAVAARAAVVGGRRRRSPLPPPSRPPRSASRRTCLVRWGLVSILPTGSFDPFRIK